MRFRLSAAVPALILLGSSGLCAQFMPITAKVRTTEETLKARKVVRATTKEGNYYRSSDGSVLRRWTRMDETQNGSGLPFGDLWDNRTASAYQLDYQGGRAYQREKLSDPIPANRDDRETTKNLKEDSVEGIRCKVKPVKLQRRGSSVLEDVGEACVSIEYHLTLRREMTYKTRNGDTVHTVFQLFDIHVGVEPDRNLFDVEKNFTVYKADSSGR